MTENTNNDQTNRVTRIPGTTQLPASEISSQPSELVRSNGRDYLHISPNYERITVSDQKQGRAKFKNIVDFTKMLVKSVKDKSCNIGNTNFNRIAIRFTKLSKGLDEVRKGLEDRKQTEETRFRLPLIGKIYKNYVIGKLNAKLTEIAGLKNAVTESSQQAESLQIIKENLGIIKNEQAVMKHMLVKLDKASKKLEEKIAGIPVSNPENPIKVFLRNRKEIVDGLLTLAKDRYAKLEKFQRDYHSIQRNDSTVNPVNTFNPIELKEQLPSLLKEFGGFYEKYDESTKVVEGINSEIQAQQEEHQLESSDGIMKQVEKELNDSKRFKSLVKFLSGAHNKFEEYKQNIADHNNKIAELEKKLEQSQSDLRWVNLPLVGIQAAAVGITSLIEKYKKQIKDHKESVKQLEQWKEKEFNKMMSKWEEFEKFSKPITPSANSTDQMNTVQMKTAQMKDVEKLEKFYQGYAKETGKTSDSILDYHLDDLQDDYLLEPGSDIRKLVESELTDQDRLTFLTAFIEEAHEKSNEHLKSIKVYEEMNKQDGLLLRQYETSALFLKFPGLGHQLTAELYNGEATRLRDVVRSREKAVGDLKTWIKEENKKIRDKKKEFNDVCKKIEVNGDLKKRIEGYIKTSESQ